VDSLAQDEFQWQAVVKTAMNFHVSQEVRTSLIK
jgi:hypothetical protein